MKKWLAYMSIFLIFLLISCSNNENEKRITRVDVLKVNADGKYEEEVIVDDNTVGVLVQVFEKMEWKRNVKVEMSRIEDVKVVLFLELDENTPERLVEYLIWFEENGTATIIDRDTNSLGKLDEKSAIILKSNSY